VLAEDARPADNAEEFVETLRIMSRPTLRFAIVAAALLGISNGAGAQQCRIAPAAVKLGETIRLSCPRDVASAKMGERTVPLFPQADGSAFGLMPVSVKEKPGIYSIEFLSAEKKILFMRKATIRKTFFPSQNVTLTPEIEALRSTPEEINLLVAFKNSVSDERFWKDPLAPPVPGCVTSPFGVKRLHNGVPTGEYHSGVDQRTPEGEPIRAVAAGVVSFAQKFNVLGNAVGVDHGQGLETMYLHMSKLAVEKGAHVDKGDVLGYAGETGRANGPHLHWVMYVNSVHVNPAQWVKLVPCPREGKRY
jgi:murein DD-endopeptidase MepM/ murein hydrolase activator NlpD